MTMFTRATRTASRLRIGIESPSGGGKTWTMLKLATELAEHDKGRIAVIDSERGSASLYSEGRPYDFDHCVLDRREPADYIAAIEAADAEGYRVIGVDSASHEWKGVLAIVDRVGQQRKGNTWSGWGTGRPAHDAFVEAIAMAHSHVICTFRSKQETEQYKDNGVTKVRKLGLAPVTDDAMDYEFTLWASQDHESHDLIITKSRLDTIPVGSVWPKGEGLIGAYFAWLGDADYAEPQLSDETLRARIGAAVKAAAIPNKAISAVVADAGGAIAYVRVHGIDTLIDEARKVPAA